MNEYAAQSAEMPEDTRATCREVMELLSSALESLDRIGKHRPATLVQHAHDLLQEEVGL